MSRCKTRELKEALQEAMKVLNNICGNPTCDTCRDAEHEAKETLRKILIGKKVGD